MTIEQVHANEVRVKIFKALADETRLQIIKKLYETGKELACGEACPEDLSSKSNASYHFRTLREAGLIKVRKEAQNRLVTLQKETFEQYLPGFLDTL
ncbi:ArsR/SmtB family transcription factor [Brevibacillus migulae]|uniref:ArsR/SmtB family transcription factor n=1 Tax=Brevibacillus migulae TaxID=1644114 RepID=UPI00106DE9B2|nr:metalloregulator ArsR/SmtB family transcription factor [Brevibacillus migulae]